MSFIEIPAEALEMAVGVREMFPGLTDPEIFIALLQIGLAEEAQA